MSDILLCKSEKFMILDVFRLGNVLSYCKIYDYVRFALDISKKRVYNISCLISASKKGW